MYEAGLWLYHAVCVALRARSCWMILFLPLELFFWYTLRYFSIFQLISRVMKPRVSDEPARRGNDIRFFEIRYDRYGGSVRWVHGSGTMGTWWYSTRGTAAPGTWVKSNVLAYSHTKRVSSCRRASLNHRFATWKILVVYGGICFACYWHNVFFSFSSPPRPLCQQCVAVGRAGPLLGAPDRSGQSRTSPGCSRTERAAPDLNRGLARKNARKNARGKVRKGWVGPLVARAGLASSRAELAQGFFFIASMNSREAAEGWG